MPTGIEDILLAVEKRTSPQRSRKLITKQKAKENEKMSNEKTSIHILPFREKGKEDYLIFFFDEEARAKFQAGEDTESAQLTGFCIKHHEGKAVTNIIIELIDGKPISVQTVEE